MEALFVKAMKYRPHDVDILKLYTEWLLTRTPHTKEGKTLERILASVKNKPVTIQVVNRNGRFTIKVTEVAESNVHIQSEHFLMLKAVYNEPSLMGIYADWLEECGLDFGFERAISELVSLGCPKIWLAPKPTIRVSSRSVGVDFWNTICLDFTTLKVMRNSGWDVAGPLVCEAITTCVGKISSMSNFMVHYNRPLEKGRVFQLIETYFTDDKLWTSLLKDL